MKKNVWWAKPFQSRVLWPVLCRPWGSHRLEKTSTDVSWQARRSQSCQNQLGHWKQSTKVLTKVFLNRFKARSLVILLIFLNLSLILLQFLKKSKYFSSGVRNPKAWCIWILTWQPNFCLFWRRLEILVIGWSWTNWSWRLPEPVWGWTHPQISASPHHKPASLCLPRSLQKNQLCSLKA